MKIKKSFLVDFRIYIEIYSPTYMAFFIILKSTVKKHFLNVDLKCYKYI